jgi:hypothetical protein
VNTLKQINLSALLDHTFFGLDIFSMLNDVEDFIEFSECRIKKQQHREFLRAERECDCTTFSSAQEEGQYRIQILDGVKFHFETCLTQRVRYATLVALITTIDWVLLSLKKRTSFRFPKTPTGKNESIHILSIFNTKANLHLENEISSLENLIHIRNCIVHAAGLLSSYKHEIKLRQTLKALPGVKVSDLNFLGDSIEIEDGFLEEVIKNTRSWLIPVEKRIIEQGLLCILIPEKVNLGFE